MYFLALPDNRQPLINRRWIILILSVIYRNVFFPLHISTQSYHCLLSYCNVGKQGFLEVLARSYFFPHRNTKHLPSKIMAVTIICIIAQAHLIAGSCCSYLWASQPVPSETTTNKILCHFSLWHQILWNMWDLIRRKISHKVAFCVCFRYASRQWGLSGQIKTNM